MISRLLTQCKLTRKCYLSSTKRWTACKITWMTSRDLLALSWLDWTSILSQCSWIFRNKFNICSALLLEGFLMLRMVVIRMSSKPQQRLLENHGHNIGNVFLAKDILGSLIQDQKVVLISLLISSKHKESYDIIDLF